MARTRYHAFTASVPIVFAESAEDFIRGMGADLPVREDRTSPDFMYEVSMGGIKMLVFSEAMMRTLYGKVEEVVVESHLALWAGKQRYPNNEYRAHKYALALAERYNRPKTHEVLRRKLKEATGIDADPMTPLGQEKRGESLESILFTDGSGSSDDSFVQRRPKANR